jgi:uncharacterized damage-inducible protein DinB
MNILTEQYNLVKDSRAVVLKYMDKIKWDDITKPVEIFNYSSMHSLMTHYLNTYINWLRRFALREEYENIKAENINSVNDFRMSFETVNSIVEEFIKSHPDPSEKITGYIPWQKKDFTYTALALFTHVCTHEFHHKGQLMTMSRILGYTPPDADAIRY